MNRLRKIIMQKVFTRKTGDIDKIEAAKITRENINGATYQNDRKI